MVNLRSNSCRLICMCVLTFGFFLVELIYGYVTNSLALVSDSYHMLSDVFSLIVGLVCVRASKWVSPKNTYGWARAEVLGALINAVFLLALCLSIFEEAVARLVVTEVITNPRIVLYVGCIGLAINIIGLFLFGTSSHGHSHSGLDGDHIDERQEEEDASLAVAESGSRVEAIESGTPDDRIDTDSTNSSHHSHNHNMKSGSQMNMRGVFLHVLGDALGSVIVIISALVIEFVDGDWKYKLDPAMSLAIVVIIVATTSPLLKESAMILLQTVPTKIKVSELKTKLLDKVDGVVSVHEFHVWQLAGNRIIASAHIKCENQDEYWRIASDVKTFFHNEGIHSTTMQPEFVALDREVPQKPGRDCALECGPDKSCFADTCCSRLKAPPSPSDPPTAAAEESSHIEQTITSPEDLTTRSISDEYTNADVTLDVAAELEEDSPRGFSSSPPSDGRYLEILNVGGLINQSFQMTEDAVTVVDVDSDLPASMNMHL